MKPFTSDLSAVAPVPTTNGSHPVPIGEVDPDALHATVSDEVVDLVTCTPVLVRRAIDLVTERAFHVIDVTDQCLQLIADSGIVDGTLTIFSPHTTCAVKINERETCFLEDLRLFMERLVPEDAYYRHDDFDIRDPETLAGAVEEEPVNGHSHIKQMLLGSSSETIPIANGVLGLGRWQRVMFIELDQKRARTIRFTAHGWR